MSEKSGHPEHSPENTIDPIIRPEDMPDLGDQVPELKARLLPGERVIRIEQVEGSRATRKMPSSLRELSRLVGAEPGEAIGDSGPAIAALALEADDTTEAYHHYEALFGRDSLRVAMDLSPYYPKLLRATIMKLAELQGVTTNEQREEEPGRIIHESRDPKTVIALELSKERGWGWPYYGSVDATPDFIRAISLALKHPEPGMDLLGSAYTGRDGETHTIADSLTAATNWVLGRMDANPEGLVEYQSPLPRGLENEVWKDSWDAYHHADGSIANHEKGVASIEVQSRAYDALLEAAEIYEIQQGRGEEAKVLKERAAKLRAFVLEKLWTEDKGGYFALGTDRDDEGNIRPLWVRTSNMGHPLNSRMLEGDEPEVVRKREAVVTALMSPEMLNNSGIRTLANDEVRFRPEAYHNGSVWLWDTHYISQGLRRHKYNNLAAELEKRIVNAANITREFPEYVKGDDGEEASLNTRIIYVYDSINKKMYCAEQPPQQVQAWSVAAILAIKKERGGPAYTGPHPHPSAFEQRILEAHR